MSLLDDAREESGAGKSRCPISRLPEDLLAEVNEALDAADGTNLTGEGVSRALAKRGHDIKSQSLNRHKRRACSCGPR